MPVVKNMIGNVQHIYLITFCIVLKSTNVYSLFIFIRLFHLEQISTDGFNFPGDFIALGFGYFQFAVVILALTLVLTKLQIVLLVEKKRKKKKLLSMLMCHYWGTSEGI